MSLGNCSASSDSSQPERPSRGGQREGAARSNARGNEEPPEIEPCCLRADVPTPKGVRASVKSPRKLLTALVSRWKRASLGKARTQRCGTGASTSPAHGLEDLAASWNAMAKDDAMWAILTDPSKRDNKWRSEEFHCHPTRAQKNVPIKR